MFRIYSFVLYWKTTQPYCSPLAGFFFSIKFPWFSLKRTTLIYMYQSKFFKRFLDYEIWGWITRLTLPKNKLNVHLLSGKFTTSVSAYFLKCCLSVNARQKQLAELISILTNFTILLASNWGIINKKPIATYRYKNSRNKLYLIRFSLLSLITQNFMISISWF